METPRTPGRDDPVPRKLTFDEYMAFEESTPLRHELIAGEVYAMSGPTLNHNRISNNVAGLLMAAAGDGPCEVFTDVIKLQVAPTTVYYPDVVVTCEPSDDDERIVRQPCLVVEVTSRSTRRNDIREKLVAYQALPSLLAYLVIDQRHRHVDRHWRDESGAWRHEEVIAGEVAVPCLEASLPLDRVYARVRPPAIGEPDAPEYAVE